MKKIIALTMLAGLMFAGCARNKDVNSGGTSDTYNSSTGSSTSTTKMRENSSLDSSSSTNNSTSSPAPQQ
ncbi:MAG: hypothetical protein QOJ40_957 [Verrucomicrobiota bacterium]